MLSCQPQWPLHSHLLIHSLDALRDMPGGLLRAIETLRWTSGYVTRHEVAAFSREAAMASEMAGLLAERAELSRQVAAMPGR